MKKRILALFLIISCLASMIVVPASAAEVAKENTTALTGACPCGCGLVLANVDWKPYKGEVNTGHYYLDGDYSQAEELTIISGNSIVLDLRGYTLTTPEKQRVFTVNGYLGILDSIGGGKMTSKGAGTYDGGVLRVEDNETSGSLIELYSGTITLRDDAGTTSSGGIVGLGDGATFRMYNGVLMGGNAKGSGGAICSPGAGRTVEILGGTIFGCKSTGSGGAIYATSGTVILKNCTIIGNTGSSGGNLYMSGVTGTIENCVISNGISTTTDKYGGGNISTVGNGTITVTNCKIYGGYAQSNGGNLSLGYGTYTFKNCEIYGGSCEGMGGNVSLPISSSEVTFNGCTIDGDMDNMKGTLTLKGATKISNNNGGLDLTESTKTVKATGLTAGAEVYVSGDKTLTGSLTYIKPALNCTLTASGTTLTVAPAADGVEAGYCPHCNAKTSWQPYGTAGATHVYLTQDMASFAEITVASDLCIDTRGFDITATGRAFSVAKGGKLAIIDSVGGSIFTGKGVAGEKGGFISCEGELILQGGKYVYAKGNTLDDGGIVYCAGNMSLSGVVMDASAYKNTTEGVNGSAIHFADGAGTATIMGAYITGGSAYIGGGLYFGYDNTVTITGLNATSGKAVEGGGNVAVRGTTENAKGTLTMTGTSLVKGQSENYAGNLQMGRYKTCTITDSYMADGKAVQGGNFSVNLGATATLTNCILEGGTATSKGGQVYAPGNNSYFTLDRCLMTNGTAAKGGNIFMNNGTCTIIGGEVSHGTATEDYGGNIYSSTDDKTGTVLKADQHGNAPAIRNGKATVKGGNIFAAKIITIEAARFSNGYAPEGGNDLYIHKDSTTLKLGSGIVGNVYTNAQAGLLTKEVYGGAISSVTCEPSEANYYLDAKYGNCGIIVKDNTMYVAVAAVMDKAGNSTWYASNEEAVAACENNQYVKLFTGNDLVLTRDLYADIFGNSVTVSGNYRLYAMDSTGDGYAVPTGKVTLSGATLADVTDAPNGKMYIALADGTIHRLGMQITGVTIRPTADGMYYTAKWSCDDVLKAQISAYGIVASTKNMPGSNFAAEEENLWTAFNQASFASGQTQNGAVISGIMSETSGDNDTRGKTLVYAKAYITFENGSTYVSRDNIGYSLQNVMESLDKLIMAKPLQYRKYNQTAREFYEKWKDNGMSGWNLTKIPKKADDNVINVLMVGSSFCYYYVQELYALGQAAGIDIRVCNLYYSGCPLEKHYNWWATGQSNYQYYETYHNGRVLTSNVSLEWGLAQHDWDFISLQESSSKSFQNYPDHAQNTKGMWEPLLSYFLEQFPDAQVLWHQPWTYQAADHVKEGTSYTPELQQSNQDKIEHFVKEICDYYNVPAGETLIQRVNTGRAWQIMRTEYDYDFLTCRLGKTNPVSGVANAGDGYHDGDIGGGQLLNACVWFEIITGQSVIGNTYIPEYATSSTLADSLMAQVNVEKTDKGYALTSEFVAEIQQAAHKAVAELGLTVQ